MQLLFPKPPSMSQQQIMVNGQFFHKYGQVNIYTPPLPSPHAWGMGNPGGKFRRRRSNHSLVATMDPVAVARRNERERNRVKQVNDGFDELKQRVPFLPDKKKLSKVEILRYAMIYIADLKSVLDEYDCNNTENVHIKKRNNSEGNSSSGCSEEEDILSTGMLELSPDELLINLVSS